MNLTTHDTSRWVRSLRPPKQEVDPWHPVGTCWEDERVLGEGVVRVLTVFLAGAECRYACVYCDLWRHTLTGPTPAGATPAQLRSALQDAQPLPSAAAIKLYNSSNFFDPRAVPPRDDTAVAELLAPFARVTVECHPRLVGQRCAEFAERVPGRLEVAMGLETIHPTALPRLNKRMTLTDFDRAAHRLTTAGIAIRTFVLLSPPFVPPSEAVESAVSTTRHAVDRGATHVSLVPVRPGNGALEELRRSGAFTPPTLTQLEDALDEAIAIEGGVVTADLWDVQRLASCADCRERRLTRLARMNLSGRREARVRCASCQGE